MFSSRYLTNQLAVEMTTASSSRIVVMFIVKVKVVVRKENSHDGIVSVTKLIVQ